MLLNFTIVPSIGFHCRFPVNAETVYTSKLEAPIPTWSDFVRPWEIRRMYRYYEIKV